MISWWTIGEIQVGGSDIAKRLGGIGTHVAYFYKFMEENGLEAVAYQQLNKGSHLQGNNVPSVLSKKRKKRSNRDDDTTLAFKTKMNESNCQMATLNESFLEKEKMKIEKQIFEARIRIIKLVREPGQEDIVEVEEELKKKLEDNVEEIAKKLDIMKQRIMHDDDEGHGAEVENDDLIWEEYERTHGSKHPTNRGLVRA